MHLRIRLLLLLLLLPPFIAHGENRPVRVGVFEYPPLTAAQPANPEDAVLITLLEHIADRENWRIETVPGTYQECLERLESGDIDLLAAALYRNELEDRLRFTRETAFSTWAQVYARTEARVESLLDLDSLSIGLVADDFYNTEIRNTLRQLNLSAQFVEFKTYPDVLEALEKGWISAGVVDRLHGLHLSFSENIVLTPILFSPREFRYASRKDRNESLIATIDFHLKQFKEDPNSIYHRLVSAWFVPQRDKALFRLLFAGLIATLCVAVFVAVLNRILRQQVKVKTRELTEKNENLKQEISRRIDAEARLEKKQAYLLTLHETALGIVRHMSGDRLLNTLLKRAAELADADHGVIYLYDPENRHLTLKANLKSSESSEPTIHDPDQGLVGEILRTGRPLLVDNYQEWEKRVRDDALEKLTSIMGIPLMSKDRVVGVISLGRLHDHKPFDPEAFEILTHFAELAAVTLENARLLDSLSQELTRRKKVEEALVESREWFRKILDSVSAGIFIVSATDRTILYANPAAAEATGQPAETIIGRGCHTFLCAANAECLVHEGQVLQENAECHLKRIDGGDIPILKTVRPIRLNEQDCYLESFIDLSDLKASEADKRELELKLQQTHKLQAIGVLAGGIAHDFNNLLSPILGYSQMCRMDIPVENKRIHGYLESIETAANRAKELVQQILTFSRRGQTSDEEIAIQPVVKEALKLMAATLPASIQIRQQIEDDPIFMRGNPTQIHQVLVNLCTNAYHAMDGDGGILEVALSSVEITENDCSPRHPLPQGPYFRLTVRDTGHGMSEAVMARIFEPYFTTKRLGKGSGLGLSVVHGIVKGYGGHIEVESRPGEGTAFHVFLPRLETAAATVTAGGDTEPEEMAPGRERVLLVDDEPQVVEVGEEMLRHLGYQVTACESATQALDRFRSSPEDYDVVVTDMTMPKMNGAELTRHILTLRPEIPVILCSGYNDLVDGDSAQEIGIRAYLQKPVLVSEMARTLRQVLGANYHRAN